MTTRTPAVAPVQQWMVVSVSVSMKVWEQAPARAWVENLVQEQAWKELWVVSVKPTPKLVLY